MALSNYLNSETIVLVPVLYIIGNIIKGIKFIPDKWIPVIILPIGIVLSMLLLQDLSVNSFIQGILTTGCATYTDQINKQLFNK